MSSLFNTNRSFNAILLFISRRKFGSGTNSRLSSSEFSSSSSGPLLMLEGGSMSSTGFYVVLGGVALITELGLSYIIYFGFLLSSRFFLI
jgi:hypothetical protein